jgi:transcriptional regulator with XRE-family HTH domain
MERPRRQALGAVLWLKNISHNSLADHLDVQRPVVSKWCEGRRRPSPEMRERIAAALDMPVEELFDDELLGRS